MLLLLTLFIYRSPGIDHIHKALIAYIKSISKRSEGDDKEKTLPIAHLGSSMVSHGEDYDANSEYGRCLTSKRPLSSCCSTSDWLSDVYFFVA